MVLLADDAHQFSNAVLLQGRVLAMESEQQVLVFGRMEDNQLIPSRCNTNRSQLFNGKV